MTSIVFPDALYAQIRERLLAESPREAAAVLLAGHHESDGWIRLLIREIVWLPPDAYSTQQAAHLSIKPEFIAGPLKRARTEGWSVVIVHSHPESTAPVFSVSDDHGETLLMPSLFARAPDRPHGSLVVGKQGFKARIWFPSEAEPRFVDRLTEVGGNIWNHGESSQETVGPEYDRSVRALGHDGQVVLSKMTVGIIGLGGTGSIVAEQLAHLGVGRFILLDQDVMEVTNLNRVVGSTFDCVGTPKVEVASRHISRIRPNTLVQTHFGSVLEKRYAKSLLSADFVFCCTDSHGSRALFNQIAYQYLIPGIDLGIRIDVADKKVTAVSGRVQMLAPRLACLVCQNLLDPHEVRRDFSSERERQHDPYIAGFREPQPAVISLNGTVSSQAVTMMLGAMTGFPIHTRHQVLLSDQGIVRSVESVRDPECIVCSDKGTFARGDLQPLPWREQIT
jgi:molybdopterin-synthase adenylyltransferase